MISLLYKLLRFSRDVNAILVGRPIRRIFRRSAGKGVGRIFGKIFR